ncbi:putative virion structural protein [Klebsiella phage vB_KvM-Eowyn]|uniref:Putative virion structural protein n=1 Tax=Klebsiella phage vB_KvM-Eowyn TaxID=2762819 RepID=A0A7R8MJL0_9CAUD|nr:putative virion structural protein [Klebsiella phage vB_KvM-Eowyn]CAD5236199.1 putative virion structural protein [Klebsiella phage vB_KvM-Eowyn]
MIDYLLDHARQHVWCNPSIDRQVVLEMSRLTPIGGVKDKMSLMWDKIALPVASTSFHVYQIGSNFPPQLNLPTTINTWINFADVCMQQNQIADFFLVDGRQYPRSCCWLARTVDRNYIVAVQILKKIDSLDTQPINLRLYSNAYFNSDRSNESIKIEVQGGVMATTSAIAALTTAFNTARSRGYGYTYAFHNGEYVASFSPATVSVGDIVEFVFDASVYRVVDFDVGSLPTFTSTLDSLAKYILHPTKADDLNDIQYRDDIDIFLYKTTSTGEVKGIYYYRYMDTAVRMLTHADYAIPQSLVQTFVQNHKYWGNATNLKLRVQMREPSFDRTLVFDANRIMELYKLTDSQIMQAMSGVNSLVPEWQAATLEASYYTKIMRSSWTGITINDVEQAYGYNAMSKLIGDTPQKMSVDASSGNYVQLPPGLRTLSTVFEFDSAGLLLGYYTHTEGVRYYPKNNATALVEVISGTGSKLLSITQGNDPVTLGADNGYRLYVSPKQNRVSTNQWVEVDPSDSTHVNVTNGVVTWTHNTYDWQGAVKQDDRFLVQQYTLNSSYDLLQFTLTYGSTAGVALTIPPGRIDIWLNKHRLVKGIDYYMVFPTIVIVNKEYLNTTTGIQDVVVRAYGFCTPAMTIEENNQYGFVQNGVLSYNNQYNLRDDRVIQITIDGGAYHRDGLHFGEDGLVTVVEEAYEGRPYEISDIVVPIRGVTDYSVYLYREQAQATDARVSAYLNTLLPEHEFPTAPDIERKYQVFSPFLNYIIGEIANGVLVVPTTPMTDKQVIDSTSTYQYLLAYDPCIVGVVSKQYEVIHPIIGDGPVSVTSVEYAYVDRIISLMLGSQVDITTFLTIED